MASGNEFDRIGVRMGEDYRVETGRNGAGRDDSNLYHAQPQPAQGGREPVAACGRVSAADGFRRKITAPGPRRSQPCRSYASRKGAERDFAV